MRYAVVFDHTATAWAVLDLAMPGGIVALHEDLDAAKDRAWHEEERWRKVYPFTPRPGSKHHRAAQ